MDRAGARTDSADDAPLSVATRPERASDDAFRHALFCVSRPPGADLAGCDAALRDTLLRQQYAGQAATYRARYPHARFDIIVHDDLPIGRVIIDRSAAAITLVDIVLMPAWRGCGVGTTLVAALCEEARQSGAPVRLSVFRGNADALRLYHRLGFVAVAISDIAMQLEWPASPPGAPS